METHLNFFEAYFEGSTEKELVVTDKSHIEVVLKAYLEKKGYKLTRKSLARYHSRNSTSAYVLDRKEIPGLLTLAEVYQKIVVV